MMGRFAFVPILNDYDFLTSINKDELKIDDEDFANRVSKRLFSLIETEKNAYRIYAKEEMMNAMLDAYLEEIKKSILKFKLYGYRYNDKDATLAIFDEIDEITNKYRINTTRLNQTTLLSPLFSLFHRLQLRLQFCFCMSRVSVQKGLIIMTKIIRYTNKDALTLVLCNSNHSSKTSLNLPLLTSLKY